MPALKDEKEVDEWQHAHAADEHGGRGQQQAVVDVAGVAEHAQVGGQVRDGHLGAGFVHLVRGRRRGRGRGRGRGS